MVRSRAVLEMEEPSHPHLKSNQKKKKVSDKINVLATEHRLEAHLVLPIARIIIGNRELSLLALA